MFGSSAPARSKLKLSVYWIAAPAVLLVTLSMGSGLPEDLESLVSGLAFWLWNAAAVLLPALVSLRSESPTRRLLFLGFLTGAALATSAFHIAWLGDIGQFQTGSSTSALIFIFIPFFACIAGTTTLVLTFVFRDLVEAKLGV